MASFNNAQGITGLFFTTSIEPSNPNGPSAQPITNGRFPNSVAALQTAIRTRFGDSFQAYIGHAKTTLIRKDRFVAPEPYTYAYQVYVKYVDGYGQMWSLALINGPTDPILLPSVAFQTKPLYLGGDATELQSGYQLIGGESGAASFYLVPKTVITDEKLTPVTVTVDVNANLILSPLASEGTSFQPNFYYLTSWTISTSLYGPPMASQTVVVDFPSWLINEPYWVQGIVAVENKNPRYLAENTIGGYPTASVQLQSKFFINNGVLISSQTSTVGRTLSIFAQIEMGLLDPVYIGNSTSGQILDTMALDIDPSSFSIEYAPKFLKSTLQPATQFVGTTTVPYTLTDRFGQPFLSLFTLFDVSTFVQIYTYPRSDGSGSSGAHNRFT